MAESVKVAVRVRPFNQREKDRKSKCCIAMDGKNTTITDPESGEARVFTFDHSYWSHDKETGTFASQDVVFKDLGVDVLENAWQGYNASLFAYGQTGSGKSFSMVGWGEERGIIPRVMESMFERISNNKDTSTTFRVQASMLEIYNERVRDLFNPRLDKQASGGLKVRENPKTGPYVEDLSLNLVSSYAHIESLMEEGNKARTIGATNMNNTSSRAHTIFQITFTQTIVNRLLGRATDRVSRINLVDLAGSERADDTGATGDRLKEACSINKSLSALGNCISALADQASGKKKVFIPYRDSVLTWLLKESLGGNAKTIMIAAVSPADINFEESLSTLRYADRAKQIKNKPTVNEDANQKMISELKQEIERLRSQLTGGGGPAKEVVKEVVVRDPEQERQLQAMRDQLLESEKLISELSMTYEEQLRKTQDVQRQRQEVLKEAGIAQGDEAGIQIKTDVPRIVNLNEDALLNECLVYFLKPGTTRVGRKDARTPQHVVLAGLNIAPEHCIFDNENNEVYLEALEGKRIFVNGKPLKARQKLSTGDRLILGTNHVFRYVNPEEAAKRRPARAEAAMGEGGEDGVVDWAFAQRELAVASGQVMSLGADNAKLEAEKREMEAKVKDMLEAQQKMAEEKAAAEKRMEDQKREAQKKMDELARIKGQRERMLQEQLKKEGKIQEMNAKMAELARQVEAERAAAQAKLEEQARMMEEQQRQFEERQRELERSIAEKRAAADQLVQTQQKESLHISALEEKLFRLIPLVNEMNMVAEQMDRPAHFDIKLIAAAKAAAAAAQDVKVRVTSLETGVSTLWDHDKFVNRVYLIREEFLTFQENPAEYRPPPPEGDPFVDVVDEVPIGTAEVYLQSLFYLIDIDDTVPIVDYKGKHEGDLSIEIKFADERGQAREVKAASFADAFMGKRLDLAVRVRSARGIPLNACRGVLVKFRIAGREFRTEESDKTTTAPEWPGSVHATVDRVTPELVKWLSTDALAFEVVGHVNAIVQSGTGATTRRGSMFGGPDVHSRRRASEGHTLRPGRHAHLADGAGDGGEKSIRAGARSAGTSPSRGLLEVSSKSLKRTDAASASPDRSERRRSMSQKLEALDHMKEVGARFVELEAILQEQRTAISAPPRPDAELARMVDEHGRQADRLAVEETGRRAAWTAAKTRLMGEPPAAELEQRHAEAAKQLEQGTARLREVELAAGSQKAVLAELQRLIAGRRERGEPDDPALAAKAKEAAAAQRKAEMERAMSKEAEKQLAAAAAAAAAAVAQRKQAEAECSRLQSELEAVESKRIGATGVAAIATRVMTQSASNAAAARAGLEGVLRKFEGLLAMQREQFGRLEALLAATSEADRAALKKAASSPNTAKLEADLAKARADVAERDAELAKLRSKNLQAVSLQDMQARLKEEEVKISEREKLHERMVIENALRIAGKRFEFKSPSTAAGGGGGGAALNATLKPASSASSMNGAQAASSSGGDVGPDGVRGSKACIIQ